MHPPSLCGQVAADHPDKPSTSFSYQTHPSLAGLTVVSYRLPVGDRKRALFVEKRAKLQRRIFESAQPQPAKFCRFVWPYPPNPHRSHGSRSGAAFA